MAIASIDPATGATIKTFQPLSASEIDDRLDRAADTFAKYKRTSFAERGENMMRAAQILEENKKNFAVTMTGEARSFILGEGIGRAVEPIINFGRG